MLIWQILGGLIILGVLLQLGLLAAESIRRFHGQRRQINLDLERLRTELEMMRDLRRKSAEPSLPWNGHRKFLVKRKVMEADGIYSFYLSPHDRKPVPEFMPGQYLTFLLDIPGEDKPAIRCYSLSDAPHPDGYRVTIKRIPSPDDKAPAGLASSFFHDRVNEGDILDVKAPSGNFYLDPAGTDGVILIGGGIGVTPILAMLNTLVARRSTREIWFFYCIRNRAEHAMKEHIEKIARENPNVHLYVCASQPDPDYILGRDYQCKGRLSVALFKQILPSNNYDFYLCGPGPMMKDITGGLKEYGVEENRIHFETFGPTSVKMVASAAPAQKAAQERFSVKFKKSGKTVPWTGSQSNILEFAEVNGIAIPSGCRAGSCGTCRIAVFSGEVGYLEKSDFDTAPGTRLTCVGIPKSDLVLDA
jgi:ferredoxin-NADP reductase